MAIHHLMDLDFFLLYVCFDGIPTADLKRASGRIRCRQQACPFCFVCGTLK